MDDTSKKKIDAQKAEEKEKSVDDMNRLIEQRRNKKIKDEEARRLALGDGEDAELNNNLDDDEEDDNNTSSEDMGNNNNDDEKPTNDEGDNPDNPEIEEPSESGNGPKKLDNKVAEKAEQKIEGKAVQATEKAAVQGAERAAVATAERAAATGLASVGWPVIAVVVGVIVVALIVLIIAFAVFAAFGRGTVGNSFQQPVSKNDPERIAFIQKYLGDNAEKSPDNPNYPKLKLTGARDEEFLKNGGTREEASLQPDQRVFDTLQFLLEGNEESRKAGFSGFSYVEVSHIVSLYEDMPINREQTVKSNVINSISTHKKGQGIDIAALGMVNSKCSCGDKVPVQVIWQDDPPTQDQNTLGQSAQGITDQSQFTGEVSNSLGDISNSNLETELGLPAGTLSQPNLQTMAQYTALADLASRAGLPSNTFVGTDMTQQARIALLGQLRDQLGVVVDNSKITGNSNLDNYLHQIGRNYILNQVSLGQLAKNSDQTPADQQYKVPAMTASQAIAQGMKIDTSALNIDVANMREMLTQAGGGAFAEQFSTKAQLLANGLNWLEMAKKAITLEIENKGKIPDGAISQAKTELSTTGSTGNFDSKTEVNKESTPSNPWWKSDAVIDSIATQMGINGSDQSSREQKDYLKKIVSNPNDEEAKIALAKTQGLKLLDTRFQFSTGDSAKILSFVEGTAKDDKGTVLNENQRIEETAKILAKNNAFSSIEQQYKIPSGSFARYLNSTDANSKTQIIQDIGVQRLASQLGVDTALLTRIVNSINPPKATPISILPSGGGVSNPEQQLTKMINDSSLLSGYLRSNNLTADQFSKFIIGNDKAKIEVGTQMAVKMGAKQLGINPDSVSSFGELSASAVGKKLGIQADTVSGLYTMWFPSETQKDAYNQMSQEEKDQFNQLRSTATQNALSQSGLIQAKLQEFGLPTTILQNYFNAPSQRTDEQLSKSDILFRDAGPMLENKLGLQAGVIDTIGGIVNNPIYDRSDKVNLVATELLKSYTVVNFENQNNLPYKLAANLFVGGKPEDVINSEFQTGVSVLNAKLGLDYYDANDAELANWDPSDTSTDNLRNKRYSLQNVLNGKIPAESVLARSSMVKTFETQYNLPSGSVSSIIDASKDPKLQSDLVNKIGGQYLDTQFGFQLTEDEKKLYPEGFVKGVLDNKIPANVMFDKIGQQAVVQGVLSKYGISDPSMLKIVLTGKFIGGTDPITHQDTFVDATSGQKAFAMKMVGGDVVGTMLAQKMGLTNPADITLAKQAVQGALLHNYDASEKLASTYGFNQLDQNLGVPSGTVQSLYNGIEKGDWSKFDQTGAGVIDQQLGLPTGTTSALKEGFANDDWNSANGMVAGYIGGKLDQAVGLPSGFSYGAYMWLTTANPMMFALAIAGPAVFDALGNLPVIGGILGGGGILGIGGGCKGSTSCYRPTAQANVHTAIEQLLKAPAEYGLDNNRVIQLITYSQERDVDPFDGDDGLIHKAYGSDHSTTYGLFSMKEAYPHLHLGF